MDTYDMKPEILYVSTYSPRKCGIATFTEDLTNELMHLLKHEFEISVCALDKRANTDNYASPVTMVMDGCRLNSCIAGAEAINQNPAIKMVCIEHEFGLFGGNMGEYVLAFLSLLTKPFIIRFHTVLPDPNVERLKLVRSICLLADKVLVMTQHSHRLLVEDYNIQADKLVIIPHGTHFIPAANRGDLRSRLHLEHKKILTTFGLLSPNKGIETGIKAMVKIAAEFPEAVYIILGNTHPNLVASEGEAYREILEELIRENNLTNNVKLVNEFIPTHLLLNYLSLTDIYLFTSRDPNQAMSGTFMYAMSAGCPIISNAFVLANEMLDKDTGIIIESGDEDALAANAIYLLRNEQIRQEMGKKAFMKTRNTMWGTVARKHAMLFYELMKKQLPTYDNNLAAL
ncbi:glycosyltransferase [Chitinophaga pinensis]|uniref:Glycosyl transferase group 1 n=1 Tax=Chitinophaga pinensis (strain ATCC 43595 / DSM 2588 / LMG 13176 / NBRC 15968 / NCIMB 11800 / UQM 2034) TaxID=485918 RepID=A0A979G969_CHIPD|nr:glycosyltransferase [Chitinophaga pinensis]ACU63028.1 glycosyl transferase group 1 [Chitinophaga pinensis DSM 2588]